MFMFSAYLFFMIMVISSTGFALSSSSLLVVWVSMEFNMMVFLPLLVSKNLLLNADTAMKYFVSQSVASAIFLLSLLMLNNQELMSTLMWVAILFKLGVAPFHSWMVSIFNSSGYPALFLFGTIQKIIPLSLLSMISWGSGLLFMLFLVNLMFVGLLFKNNSSVRLVMFISTVSNSVWAVSGTLYLNSWFSFMLVYTLANLFVFSFLHLSNISKGSQLSTLPPTEKLGAAILFLSLGGMPPLLGFFQKVIILKELLLLELTSASFLLLGLSVVVLYAYLSLSLNSFILNPGSQVKPANPPTSVGVGATLTMFLSLFSII